MKALTYIEHGKFALGDKPKQVIVCEKDPARIAFVHEHYPDVLTCAPENCKAFTIANSDHGGADVMPEVAGAKDTFQLAWECVRPNAIVTVVALYDDAQPLPLPQMYGKIDTTPRITHRDKLEDIEEAYRIFEKKLDGVIKVAITH